MVLESQCRILIVGGGTGGVAAAMAAASLLGAHTVGNCASVILTEETDWLGGQFTSQAVPPDEHDWIEERGCTHRYRTFRERIRQYYRDHYPLTKEALNDPTLNPGLGLVSQLCHEPRVALTVMEEMLACVRSAGTLDVRLRRKPISAEVAGDRVCSVRLLNLETGDEEVVHADFVLDATELGDLLPLAGVEYVTGAESQAETGEPHAPMEAQPRNVQAFSWCFPMAFDPKTSHVIEKPARYDHWRDYVPHLNPPWPGRLFSWQQSNPITLQPQHIPLFEETGLTWWTYRRIVCADHYPAGAKPHEVTLVNWPQTDYSEENLIDQPPGEVARILREARELSLSFFYWMQTEAPRADGGTGYPGLYLRPDLVGTHDGLAKSAYIRESRRIKAMFTVTENHIGVEARGGHDNRTPHPDRLNPKPEVFADSVGIGCYRIDLHPTTGGDNYLDIASLPFQIPLGALVPVRIKNLLPSCKNIGVTHITNGCYRLHPVEWNIGESSGLLAAFCFKRKLLPLEVYQNTKSLEEFQSLLRDQGVELSWSKR